jgi:hypothetical protein
MAWTEAGFIAEPGDCQSADTAHSEGEKSPVDGEKARGRYPLLPTGQRFSSQMQSPSWG